MRTLAEVTSAHYSVLHNNILAPAVGWYARPYLYQFVASLPFALGWPTTRSHSRASPWRCDATRSRIESCSRRWLRTFW